MMCDKPLILLSNFPQILHFDLHVFLKTCENIMALKFFSKIQLCMGLTLLEVLFAANYCSAVGDSCNEMSNSKTIETCEMFKPEEFTKDSTSIIYGEAQGRFGNQLLGYIVLLQVCIGVPPQLVHTA